MKAKKYIRAAVAVAVALGAAACDENAWNDHLNGFDKIEDQPVADVQTVEYTLASADYSTIAGLEANKTIAGEDGAAALAAVGSLKSFSAEAPASLYVPAFLSTSGFPYFTLTQGSAVKLTYNKRVAEDPALQQAREAQILKVDADYYTEFVWESEENFVDAFAPSHPAAEYLPAFLTDVADPNDGIYAIVSYKQALQEPSFGGGGSIPSGPVELFAQTFTEDLGAFTIDNRNMPADLEYIWSWGGSNYGAKASAFANGTSYASESWLVSPVVDLSGASGCTMVFEHVVNKFPDLEFAKANCTLWGQVDGQNTWTQITIPTYSGNDSWSFVSSGDVSLAAFDGKKMRFAFKYVSEDGKSGTWEVKNLTITGTPGAKAPARAGVFVPTENRNAIYHYDGTKWTAPADMVMLQPADYTEMGQSHPNLSKAEPFISVWLMRQFPYAAEGDVKNVVWNHYASGASSYDCSQYVFDGLVWTPNNFVEECTEQFVYAPTGWIYDPNVTINLPAGKNQPESTKYFQACVDWVFENICKPLGDTSIKSGLFYISSYGNNEYYSGTSAFQGNVDLRPSAAQAQYPAEYGSMSDDEIVALEKKRFMEEVMPGALAMLHPDAKPMDGIEVLYIINFSVYNGSATTPYTATFKVVAPGTFEPVGCTWDEAE